MNNSINQFQKLLFLPEGIQRKGEGGLRTKGYFKKSYEDKPLISIVTVVFNGEKYLEETIQSVLNQTYDNVEYIIIDGGSTDGTLDIIKKYDDKIDYWVSEGDKGIYDAMNKGIDTARGEWINFMNAGDSFFENTTLNNLYKSLETCDVLYGNHAIRDNQTKQYNIIDVKKNTSRRNIPFCHQSVFIKSIILKQFQFDINLKIAADYDQFLKIQSHGYVISHFPMLISIYLEGGLSDRSRELLIKEYYYIMKKYNFFYASFVYLIRKIKFFFIGV